ncbi:Cox5b/Cox5a [Lipomyces oligophaga]|uniref:Cox5b/Cox5a n=1 Tax=Lipomyces oligophaga TaxID=45792 RepID=UPI0034CFDBC5
MLFNRAFNSGVSRVSAANALRSPATLFARWNSSIAGSDAIATPLIIDLPARWEKLPVSEQVDITVKIWERQKADWTDLTLDEKRASFYISYGPWGPRKPMHSTTDYYKIYGGIVLGLAVSAAVFATARSFAGPVPHTMTKEWQEASDKLYKDGLTEPFSGDWTMVQSDPGLDIDDE